MNQPDLFTAPPPAARPDQRQRARAGRDRGMQRAVDHADRTIERWSDRAEVLARQYLAAVTGQRITGERIRQHAEAQGLPNPPDKRAWGSVTMRLARAGLLRKVGWTTASDPKVHCNPVSEWEVVGS